MPRQLPSKKRAFKGKDIVINRRFRLLRSAAGKIQNSRPDLPAGCFFIALHSKL